LRSRSRRQSPIARPIASCGVGLRGTPEESGYSGLLARNYSSGMRVVARAQRATQITRGSVFGAHRSIKGSAQGLTCGVYALAPRIGREPERPSNSSYPPGTPASWGEPHGVRRWSARRGPTAKRLVVGRSRCGRSSLSLRSR
jgi:hypothetical protein